ncbi:hypothetical protein KZC52_14110 [Microbacterium sp. kSW2-24]|uniref:hypothetical protein n=1 Tax=Microbacterium galbinum TaxID=2851646 RepID=UPI001FFC41F9|nr:hypothetical protein [Microbacterium galbinum]MCK2024069.1 hypothetical protein [Microbacterium galbinum]
MGNSKNPTTGKRVFNDVYSFPQDSQDLADDIHDAWNVRRGPASARTTFPEGQLREGLIWVETDTRISYRWFSATGWQPTDALVLLARQSVTGAGTMNFDNVFSSRFENYLVRVNIRSMSAGGVPAMQLRSGGNPAAGASDYRSVSRTNSSTAIAGATTGEDRAPLTKASVAALYAEVRIFDPGIASRTVFLVNSHGVGSTTAAENGDLSVQHNPAVAYDGFRMLTSGPLITGAVSVFGIG